MRVDLNGQAFSGLDTDEMARWICQSLDGWDSPQVRQTILQATGRHGGRMSGSYYGTRPMVLAGKALAKNGHTADELADHLAAVTDLVTSSGLLTVHEQAPKRCRVFRAGESRIARPTNTRIEFSIPLVAVDPIKYSTTLTETTITVGSGDRQNAETVPNGGEFPIEPEEIIVSGSGKPPLSLIRLDRGHRIRLLRNLADGRYVIDPQDRHVRYGPVDAERHRYRYVGNDPRWFTIPPGGTLIRARRASTTGTMTVKVYTRDGWA